MQNQRLHLPTAEPALIDAEQAACSEELIAEGARRTLNWMLAHRMFGGPDNIREYQKKAIVAATFGFRCAPRRADAQARLRTAKFTALFLYLDDTTSALVMSETRWLAFHSELMARLQGSSAGNDAGNDHAAVTEWLTELDELGQAAPLALRDFRDSFRDYCQSLDAERRADPATMSAADFLTLRRRTIFVEPVLNQWRVVLGIDVSRDDPGYARLMAAQAIARELVILANDLGSLDRDSTSETTEHNLILFNAHRLGIKLDVAVARAVTEYNALVGELRRSMAHGADAGIAWFQPLGDLLVGLVDGNLDSMLVLALRYANKERGLHLLHRLQGASS